MESVVNQGFWKGKRVFITGHTGFKGAWLTLWLKRLGGEVTGYSLEPPTTPSLYDLAHIEDAITGIEADVRDFNSLRKALETYHPEIVFHLAAQALVRRSYRDPIETYATNVMGTVNLLEAVRQVGGVRAFVNVTSDKCYENREWVWGYRENEPMGGHDPYSASKGCAELVFSAYLKSFFSQDAARNRQIGAASARAGNVIGGSDWGANRLVPDCIRALSRHQPSGIRNPRAVRPWQHVLEPLSGYLQLGALLSQDPQKYSGAWNFGPDNRSHLTAATMADRLIKYWGSGAWDNLSDPKDLHEAKLLKLNCDKAHAELNWHSALTIEECLRMTAEWYKKFYTGNQNTDIYALCVEQIHSYMDNATKAHLP